MTKKIHVIFHYLRGYDSHLILQEIDKIVVEINVISNGLEKFMDFTISNNLVFADSMQSMNSSLNALIKNFSNNDFKYCSLEFSGDLLELVKGKRVYLYGYMGSFKIFLKINNLISENFVVL